MKLVLSGMLVIVIACGQKGGGGGGVEPKRCVTPGELACSIFWCGGNSAIINAFPINGLRSDGDCSPEGAQLVPGSLHNAHCAGSTLGIEGGKLVGRNADGSVKCRDGEVLNATFLVRTEKDEEKLEITEVTEYTAANQQKFPAYRIEWTKENAKDNHGKRKGLCTSKQGQKLRQALKMKKVKFTDDLPDPTKELVIPIRSELYDEHGDPVPINPSWKVPEKEWLNLACVDDSLAKRTMWGQLTADDAKSRAALRMWTADYCQGVPFTYRGQWIAWDGDPTQKVEAQWTAKNASCLTNPRIIFDDNGNEAVPSPKTQRVKDLCKTDCTKISGWKDAARTCYKEDGVTIDRVIPACPPKCITPACLHESRIAKKQPPPP